MTWPKIGWGSLAVTSLLIGAASIVGAIYGIGFSLWNHLFKSALVILGSAVITCAFWWWIHLGARLRYARAVGRKPSRAERAVDSDRRSYVLSIFGAVVFVAFLVASVWGTVAQRNATDRAEELRDEVIAVAHRRKLTTEQVRVAWTRWATVSWEDKSTPVLQNLLPLEQGKVVWVSVDGQNSTVRIRPNGGGPPCVVLDITNGNQREVNLTRSC